jgi:cell division protease FtsH
MSTTTTQNSLNYRQPLHDFYFALRKKILWVGKIALLLLVFVAFFTASEITRLIYTEFNREQVNYSGAQTNPPVSNLEQIQAQAGMAGDTSFIQFLTPEEVNTKFTDIGGMQEAKEEVTEVVEFLKNPEKFEKMGAKIPKGILLVGAPGTGKTLLARAVAGEANVAFLSVSGATFQNGWIGTGGTRVKVLFEEARKRAPAIIFIDEIESLLPHRVINGMGGDQEYAATVNQFLAEMDGIDKEKNQGIIVMGASNNIEGMDKAALRPGRFDRHVFVSNPTLIEREEILKISTQKVPLAKNVDIKTLARNTVGFSGADLRNLVNEAAINAATTKKKVVDLEAIDYANDKILLGKKRPTLILGEKERKIVAYHEAGHALVGIILNMDPIQKISITPRGEGSLGVTSFSPASEYYLMSKSYLEGKIALTLAGRAAEELIFGENNVTNGAESDLKTATEIANEMVKKWGMSKLGAVYHLESFGPDAVETEIRTILDRNQKLTQKILQDNLEKLHALAKALLQHENLNPAEIKKIMETR